MAQTKIKIGQTDVADSTTTLTNKTLTNPTINFTDKAVAQNVRCSVYLGTASSGITNASFTKIDFDTELYDTGGDFDTANSRFVAPVSGYYLVNMNVTWTTVTADKYYSCAIYVNGSRVEKTWNFTHSSVASFLSNGVSAVVYVGSGQYIEGYVYHAAGVNTPVVRADRTGIDIMLLST